MPADQPAIAIVDAATRDDVLQEAVALEVNAVDARSNGFAQWPRDSAADADRVIIAVCGFAGCAEIKRRLCRDNRDQTRRRVAPEQCPLWPAQHFDTVDRAEFGQADTRAVAVNTVDKRGDRAFETGVVTDRADAADTCAARCRFGRRGRHEQRWRQLIQRANVAGAGVGEALRGHCGDSERNVRQRFGTAGRGDNDVAGRAFIGGLCFLWRRGFLSEYRRSKGASQNRGRSRQHQAKFWHYSLLEGLDYYCPLNVDYRD